MWSCTCGMHTVGMCGSVIPVLVQCDVSSIPLSSEDEPPYVAWLIDGSIISIAPSLMEEVVDLLLTCSSHNPTVSLPLWLGQDQKVMFLKDGFITKVI